MLIKFKNAAVELYMVRQGTPVMDANQTLPNIYHVRYFGGLNADGSATLVVDDMYQSYTRSSYDLEWVGPH